MEEDLPTNVEEDPNIKLGDFKNFKICDDSIKTLKKIGIEYLFPI